MSKDSLAYSPSSTAAPRSAELPGAPVSEWFDDDALWAFVRQAVFPASSFQAGPSEVAAVFELAGLAGRRGLDVLDIPCGPGRHSLPLAQAGHRVLAVDRTQSYLDALEQSLAERRAAQSARDFHLQTLCCDMRALDRSEAFDLAINLYTSLGYFEDLDDDRAVLRNLHRALRPGGKLVVDLLGREILARNFVPRDWKRLDDGTIQLMERRITDSWRWVEVQWTFLRDGVERSFDFSHRVWGSADLGIELQSAGFSEVELFGGFDGRPYDLQATRLVAVATA